MNNYRESWVFLKSLKTQIIASSLVYARIFFIYYKNYSAKLASDADLSPYSLMPGYKMLCFSATKYGGCSYFKKRIIIDNFDTIEQILKHLNLWDIRNHDPPEIEPYTQIQPYFDFPSLF